MVAGGEQLCQPGGEPCPDQRWRDGQFVGKLLDRPERVQVPVAVLEVRVAVEAEARCQRRELQRPDQRLDLGAVPDVVAAFDAFRVGVQARIVAARRRLHLAQHPVRRAAGRGRERRGAGRARSIGIQREKRPKG